MASWLRDSLLGGKSTTDHEGPLSPASAIGPIASAIVAAFVVPALFVFRYCTDFFRHCSEEPPGFDMNHFTT